MLIRNGAGGGCGSREQEKLQQEYNEHRQKQAERDAENLRLMEFLLKNKPAVGSTVLPDSEQMAIDFVFFNAEEDVYPAVYVFMYISENDPPCYRIASEGKKGIKVFLNKRSRGNLRKIVPTECFETGGRVLVKGKIRIVGYSESQKAAHGELVFD